MLGRHLIVLLMYECNSVVVMADGLSEADVYVRVTRMLPKDMTLSVTAFREVVRSLHAENKVRAEGSSSFDNPHSISKL